MRRLSIIWLTVAGCSAYDSTLLQHKTQPLVTTGGRGGAAAKGSGGAGSGAGAGTDGGTAGGGGSISVGQLDATVTRCGDGVVTGAEKCDTGIAAGMPGSCPTDCLALAPCSPRKLNNGGGCQAECVVLQAGCMNDDKCCPTGCNNALDNDCSAHCGDGSVQEGETCGEPTLPACKTMASDCNDDDPCTVDMLTGSAATCNAACTHAAITTLMDGDGCCPKGATANNNTDKDCPVTCGNGVVEAGEKCDSSVGCSSDCKSNSLTDDQMRCLRDYASDACGMCSCMNCAAANQYIACMDLDKAAGNTKCVDVLNCARKNNCTGQPCYCSSAVCPLLPFGTAPDGPCVMEVEAAAGGGWAMVQQQDGVGGNPLGDSHLADTCRVMNCKASCR